MQYIAEPIPVDDIKSTLDTYWDTQSGNIPEPTWLVENDGTNSQTRVDLRLADYVILESGSPTEEETPIGSWVYCDRRYQVALRLYTEASRQRLYDLAQEIRRVCHEQMHLLTNFQQLQFISFQEQTEMQQNIWAGRILVELRNDAIDMEIGTSPIQAPSGVGDPEMPSIMTASVNLAGGGGQITSSASLLADSASVAGGGGQATASATLLTVSVAVV